MTVTHVALLRGINVGRAKRIAMSELRSLVAALGYEDVRTLLNSGNVVFGVPAAAKGDPGPRIEKAIAAQLGITSRVTVLTAKELSAIVAANPLLKLANDPSRLMVCFLFDPADRTRLQPLSKQDWGDDALAVGKRVAYVWCKEGVLASQLMTAVGKALGDAVTARNWATVLKIHALVEEPG